MHEQMDYGLSRVRQSGTDFMPSPGRFAKLCRGSLELYGLPDDETAFEDACVQSGKPAGFRNFKHAAVFLAASSTGFFDLKTARTESEIKIARKRFTRFYRALCDQVMRGEKLVVPEECRIKSKPRKATPPPAGLLNGLMSEL